MRTVCSIVPYFALLFDSVFVVFPRSSLVLVENEALIEALSQPWPSRRTRSYVTACSLRRHPIVSEETKGNAFETHSKRHQTEPYSDPVMVFVEMVHILNLRLRFLPFRLSHLLLFSTGGCIGRVAEQRRNSRRFLFYSCYPNAFQLSESEQQGRLFSHYRRLSCSAPGFQSMPEPLPLSPHNGH